VRADEEAQVRSLGAVQGVRRVDDDLARHVLRAREPEDFLDRGAEGREDEDLPMLRRLLERPRRGLPLRLLLPHYQSLALRIPRGDFHVMTAAGEAASECLRDFAAAWDTDLHGSRLCGGLISL